MEMPGFFLDSESTKNIFYNVGLTFYAAHSFEECLRGFLVGIYVMENPSCWQANYSKETNDLNKLPLGKLLEKAKLATTFEAEVEAVLKLALIKRNHFIHFYFYESFGLLSETNGHQKIISDMIELRTLFQKAENKIQPLSYELMIKAGMTKELILQSAQIGIKSQLSKSHTVLDKWRKTEKQKEELASKISTQIIEKYQQKLKDMDSHSSTKNIGPYRTAEIISNLNKKDFSKIISIIIDLIKSFETRILKKTTQAEFEKEIESIEEVLDKTRNVLQSHYVSQFLSSRTEELAYETRTLIESITKVRNLISKIEAPSTLEDSLEESAFSGDSLEEFVTNYDNLFVPKVVRVMQSKKNSDKGNSRLMIICLYLNPISKSTGALAKLAEEIICELNKELEVLKIDKIRSYPEEEIPQKIKDIKDSETWKKLKSYVENEVFHRLGGNPPEN